MINFLSDSFTFKYLYKKALFESDNCDRLYVVTNGTFTLDMVIKYLHYVRSIENFDIDLVDAMLDRFRVTMVYNGFHYARRVTYRKNPRYVDSGGRAVANYYPLYENSLRDFKSVTLYDEDNIYD